MHDGKPDVRAYVLDGGSLRRLRFQQKVNEVPHFGAGPFLYLRSQAVLPSHLVLHHLALVPSVKGIDVVEEDEEHHP